MSDHKTNQGFPEGSCIKINEETEVEYWCRAFKCTRRQLEEAMRKVGISIAAVREELLRK